MNQPTLRPAVVPVRPRPAGFRAACLALLSACLFGFASAKADPGQALNFDGIDDKVTIPHRAELNSLPLTVECWFKPTASGSGVSSIVNKYVASSGNGWAIHYAGGQVSGWYYAVPGYVNTTLLGVTVSLNTWHHVAMVVETTGSKLYVDGVLASSAVWSGAPTVATTTQDVTLGEYAGNVAGGKFFPGAIDEVRIWNGARSLAEIQAFKDTEIASMPSCLMAYYKFSEGSADGVNTGVTALPDIANAFADDGTLSNFALTGTTGNWTTGPTLTAVTSTYAAAPDINLVGNGNPILDGTTATATGNNTDFGSSLVGTGVPKTFTLENTGTSALTVSALSFSGANPGDYAVSGITLPATVAANGSTTFAVTFTPTAVGARTATLNVVNDDCDESNYDFALTGAGTLPPATALHFDGSNDYVSVPHSGNLPLTTPFTVESWIYVEATSEPFPTIVSKNSNNLVLWLQEGTSSHQWRLCARLGGTQVTAPAADIAENTWTHVAMTFDGTSAYLYKDGVLLTSGGVTGPTLNTSPFLIGYWEGFGRPFHGKMDELRVWTGARSAAELQAAMNTELAIMPSCLVAYFKFNQGVAGGSNAGETTAPNLTGGPSGTLNNFALTGPTSNWTTGSGIAETASVLDLTAPEINLVGNGQNIALGDYVPGTADDTDFGNASVGGSVTHTFTVQNVGSGTLNVSAVSSSGTHAADFTVGALTPAGAIAGSGSATFTVTFSPSGAGLRSATITVQNDDCNEAFYTFAVQGTGTLPPATALHFDGVNDSVDIPHQPGQLSFPFTVEAWVKTTDSHGLLVSKYVASSGNGWQMGTEGGKLTAWFFRPGGAGAIFPSGSGIVGATTINNDVWHHVAFVVDSTGGRLYVDGVSDGFSGWTWGTPGTATTTAPVRLGDVTMQTVYPFAGTLDEVRIWAVARSAAELQTYKAAELAVMPPCLVGYYKLNHGTVGANNAGVDSAVDETGGASGTLNNFGLTGPTGNWTDGSGITPETSVPDPTAPEINLTGNTLDIALADTTPRPEDDTDFGNAVVLGSPVVRTFTVQNTGPGASVLNVSGISVTGAHPANFVAGPLNPVGPIAGGGSATFTVTFSPSAAGLRSATVTVNNDDCNESAYSFAVQGTGVNTAPTVVATSATITINEGTATSNGLTVNDAENNSVTVTASVGSIGVLASATYVTEFATTTTPRRFDFDSAGNIYVGNLAGVVTKYDPNGNQLLQFTLASPGVFNDSENFTGIDVDAAGNIYVSYSGHTHTRKYDSAGNLIGNFGPPTQQVYIRGGRFGGPNGNFYQLDRSHRLVLVNPSGTELWRTSGYNAGNNEPPNTGLNGNLDVAIHPTTGTAYVGDFGFIKGFDVTGATTGYFNTVGGQNNSIDMDAQGNLWTASATTIRKYTTAGIALGSFGTAGTGAGQFQLVTYLRFDAAGNLWALDQTRNKLIKFNVGQSSYAWLHTPADGPAGPTTVTITATDSLGASGQTTFTLNVNNVAPTATFSRSAATANENTVTPPSVSFTGQVDPGTTDVSTGLKYSYDYNNDGTWDDGDGTYAGSLTAATKTIPASYFASPAPASLTVKGRVLDKDGGLTDYTVSITINHAPTAINGPLSIVEDFDYGTSAGTLSGNGGAGFSTAWNGGSYTPTGLTFSSLTSPGGAWNGGGGSRNFAASLAAAGPITGDFLFSMSSAPPGRVQMFGLGGLNNQGFTIALAPANDSTPTGGVPIVGLNSGGYANVTAGAVALNTTYLYRFAYAGSSITVWILSAAQYDNFAPGGLTDAELNAATIGTGATQVTGRVTKVGNVTANMANLFTYTFGGGGVTMDRVRMTGQPVGASLVVAENAAINTSVGTLTPSDADSGNTFTFSLVNGAGDADNASFNINGSTLRSSAVFNYEVRNSYSIRVRVTDQGGLSYETPLTVTISNVNEAVTDVALSPSSIAENNAANATVGTLSATDGDTGDTHTFTLVTGTGNADNGSFTIAGNALKLTPSADFETKSSYALRVRATDAGGLFFEKPLTVTVIDVNEAPVLQSSQLVYETVTPTRNGGGAIVYSVDNSVALAAVPVARVRYRMQTQVSGVLRFADVSFDAWAGLTVAGLRVPDLATPFVVQRNVNNLTVVSDYPGVVNASGQTGRLELWPWDYFPTASAGVGGDSGIYDFDDAPTGNASYGSFQVHNLSSSPKQTVLAWNNHGSTPEIGFGNSPSGHPDWTFAAGLGTVNWKLQIFIDGNVFSIPENSPVNTSAGTLVAGDPDTGAVLTYSLVPGAGDDDNASFTVSGTTLRSAAVFDYETKSSYKVRLRVTDQGGLFSEQAATVTITDLAENVAPTVARDAATVTVPEGTTAFNSGTFADANSDTVTITASVGTITQSGAGTWTHQQTLTQGGTPIELTLDSQENLYVANEGQNTLYKYDSSGSLVTSWTVAGSPTGVAVDSANGWLYVALKNGHRIDKFTLSGTLLTSWGSNGSGDGQFSSPHCVAVDAAGDVYVADSGNNRIQVFSPAGAFLRKWGSTGSGDGEFNFPQGLRISPGGTLYVADRNNDRVQYFNTAGTFAGKWGSAGSGDGQFSSPAGIGIDPGGNVVVGDIFNHRIQKFTATGTFVDKLGPSTAAGNLALPHGTAFPPSGRSVYIADFANGRVVKFATPGGWNWSFSPADGAAGPTPVTITATDNGSPNLSSTTTFTLNVNNVAPTIALTGNPTVPNGTPYTLNLGAITDPGTDTVSAFSINWGDGNTENFTGNPASTAKTHTYATLGSKTITVTLTDEDGTFTGGTKSVTVENAAPVAVADGLNRPNTTKVAKVLKSDLLGNDSDADGDPLTLTAVGNALPAGATVTLAGNFVVYTAPANNAGNGSFTYTLSAGAHTVTGTVTVTETTTSGGGGGTPNYLTLVPSGDDFIVTFLGVPGGSFRVQYSTAGPPNYDWQEFISPAIYTAAPNGVFTHTDVNPPGPVRFYRAVSNP